MGDVGDVDGMGGRGALQLDSSEKVQEAGSNVTKSCPHSQFLGFHSRWLVTETI